ncbi:MAG: hypothetical protein K1X54_08770 [Flavobacteriales bacterium]|nr:hypothetical protein [Flavobacteriales bacterium]
MRFILTQLLVLFCLQQSQAQLKIWHRYKPGTKYTFEYSKTKNDGTGTTSPTNVTPFYLTIDKEDAGGIHATWKIGATVISGLTEAQKKEVEPFLNINKDFEVKITLDKEGSLIAVENYDACVAHIKSMGALLKPLFGNTSEIDELIDNLSEDVETFLRVFFPEIRQYFDIYANTWNNGVYYIEEDIMEIAGIGSSIPFESEVTVTNIPSKKMEVNLNQVYNKEVLANAKEQYTGDPQPWFSGLGLPEDLELKLVTNYKMNPLSRMVESLTLQKSASSEGKTMTEQISFVLRK